MIKLLVFLDNTVLISKIEESPSELGEPDCKLSNPFEVKKPQIDGMAPTLESWLSGYTKQNEFMIHSDKILTIADPTARLIELYEELTK
jgi:hypothetical protein